MKCRQVTVSASIALIGPLMLLGTLGPNSAAAQVAEPTATDPISVSAASGRTFIGQLDPQTDGDLLWLRVVDGPIVVRRPIEWGRVVRVRQGEKELSPDALREAAKALKSESHEGLLPAPPVAASDWTAAKTWLTAATGGANQVGAVQTIGSLQIDAELGHWTPGVETSGIVVCIHPTSANGTLLPVDGTLAVDLVGQIPASQGQSDGLTTLGRWNANGASVRFRSAGSRISLRVPGRPSGFRSRTANAWSGSCPADRAGPRNVRGEPSHGSPSAVQFRPRPIARKHR